MCHSEQEGCTMCCIRVHPLLLPPFPRRLITASVVPHSPFSLSILPIYFCSGRRRPPWSAGHTADLLEGAAVSCAKRGPDGGGATARQRRHYFRGHRRCRLVCSRRAGTIPWPPALTGEFFSLPTPLHCYLHIHSYISLLNETTAARPRTTV